MAEAMTKIEDAQAHAYSLANEALAKYLVEKGVGKMLLDLAMMRPYLIELASRFKQWATTRFRRTFWSQSPA
jgi:hypothetical protein